MESIGGMEERGKDPMIFFPNWLAISLSAHPCAPVGTKIKLDQIAFLTYSVRQRINLHHVGKKCLIKNNRLREKSPPALQFD